MPTFIAARHQIASAFSYRQEPNPPRPPEIQISEHSPERWLKIPTAFDASISVDNKGQMTDIFTVKTSSSDETVSVRDRNGNEVLRASREASGFWGTEDLSADLVRSNELATVNMTRVDADTLNFNLTDKETGQFVTLQADMNYGILNDGMSVTRQAGPTQAKGVVE